MVQACFSRRTFLAATAATAVATRAARARVSGANDRLSIGFIAVGERISIPVPNGTDLSPFP